MHFSNSHLNHLSMEKYAINLNRLNVSVHDQCQELESALAWSTRRIWDRAIPVQKGEITRGTQILYHAYGDRIF